MSKLKIKLFGICAFLLCLIVQPASADIFKSAEFEIAHDEAELTYVFSAEVATNLAVSEKIIYPDFCREISVTSNIIGRRTHLVYTFTCEKALSSGDQLIAPWALDGARLDSFLGGKHQIISLIGEQSAIAIPLDGEAPPKRPLLEVMKDFLWQGALHIAGGWDHLAFVLCLCLISNGRHLIALVSTFTLGHSISLGLSFFNVVQVSIPPVEAVIALSIAFVAREALVKSSQQEQSIFKFGVLIAAFGLLHGLGFASALGEFGVPPHEKWPALIFFNLGVELGQLIFVIMVVSIFFVLRRIGAAGPARIACLYGVGIIGSYWMIERVVGFADI